MGDIEKTREQSENFDKQFQKPDGTLDKATVNGYLDGEIVKAETETVKYKQGTPEREKTDRRVRMLKIMKNKMADGK